MAEPKASAAPPPVETAPAPAATSAGRKPLFSPAGLVVLVVVLIAEAGIVFAVTKVLSTSKGVGSSKRLETKEITLSLTTFKIKASGGVGLGAAETSVEVTLRLNPALSDPEGVRGELSNRMPFMIDRVGGLLYKNAERYLTDPDLSMTLKRDIKELLNGELGTTEPGKEIIDEVYIKVN